MAIKPPPGRTTVLIGKFFHKEWLEWLDIFRKAYNALTAGLAASRIVATDSDSNLEDVDDLTDWIAGTTGHIDVADDGDGTLTLSIGISYGSLYIHEGAVNVDISTAGQGVYVKITGFTTGLLNNVTINSDAFNVGTIGIYKVDWQISGDSAGNNKDYEFDLFVNGVEEADGSAKRAFGAAGSLGSMSGTAILNITDTSHDIDIRAKEPGAGVGTDFDIFNMNFNIIQIG